MLAKDFILEASLELQEKNKVDKFWKDEELFLKLARAYRTIQSDIPCFTSNEKFEVKEGIELYYTKHKAIKGISLYINNYKYVNQDKKYLFTNESDEKIFNVQNKEILINPIPKSDDTGRVVYYYLKELENENDYITTPIEYEEAIRLLFFSYIFEKPPRDFKDRDLSIHYLKRYEIKKDEIKKRVNTKSVNSNYQRI